MHGARKAEITKELENVVKDFGFCRRFILNSNTFTRFYFFSLFFFFFCIVCREKFKHIFLKRQVKFVYTNIYTSPTHEKSISDDLIPSLKPTYCPSYLGILLEFYLRHTKVLFFWLLYLTYLTLHVQTNRTACKRHISRIWNK